MQIKVNEHTVEVADGTRVEAIRDRFKPGADLVILNGFPVSLDTSVADGDEVYLIRRGEVPPRDELEHLLVARHTPRVYERLKNSRVGIAGVGGLGSTVAVALARVGVGELVIADFDVVEPSNLNRQQYFVDQLGRFKVDALTETLHRINPYVTITPHRILLAPDNVPTVFAGCSVLVEAFDRAEMKSMLVDTVITNMVDTVVVAASGLAGYGPNNAITTRRISRRLYLVGDLTSEAQPGNGLMAPRVGIAASHQANQVVRILLGEADERR
jgi:sulfur carrier protein ThiS adenylyltransferase